ncbi:MAG: hypothetical protein OHK0039_47940 [Bacteroidia bacterium]
MSLCADDAGVVWAGTWSEGLNRIDIATGLAATFDRTSDGEIDLRAAPIISILRPRHCPGKLWVGTRGSGVYRLAVLPDGLGTLAHDTYDARPGSLASNYISQLYEDREGRIWVCTEEGLSRFDAGTGTYTSFILSQRPPQNNLQAMLQDPDGRYWLGTHEGLLQIVALRGDTAELRSYDKKDGLAGNALSYAACIDAAGRLLFGGSVGISYFDPAQIREDRSPARPVVTRFSLFNRPVAAGETIDGQVLFDRSLALAPTIRLTHRQNVIAFEFAGLHYVAPQKNRYAFRLEGWDDTWHYRDASQRLAAYSNLPPGHYTFVVRAANHNGIWSSHTARIPVVIAPPFWQTPGAYALYALLVLGLLLAFRRIILIRVGYRNSLLIEWVKREKAEEVNQMKLNFFTNISHELRTPLTLILAPLEEFIRHGAGDAATRRKYQSMYRNGQRLLRLITQLMDFRKQESGLAGLRAFESDLMVFAREIYLFFQDLAHRQAMTYTFDAPARPVLVWFDPEQLEKVLYNLLSNAFKYSDEGGTIAVEVACADGSAVVRVRDRGRGIAAAHLPHIFDRFYRVEQGTEHHEVRGGTGLGMALARSIAEQHGGSLDATSAPGQGSCFTLRLPLGKDHLAPEQRAPEGWDGEKVETYTRLRAEEPAWSLPADMPVAPAPDADPGDRPRVLLVEDNPDIRELLRVPLSVHYEVEWAAEGRTGLQMAREGMPDLVISDIVMPEMDGIALCCALKTDWETSHIPVMLLTARTSLIYQIDGLGNGADDYLTKPFHIEVLLLRVRNLIESRRRLRERFGQGFSLAPGEVTLNPPDETFLRKAIALVEDHMADSEYSVEAFGRDLGVSRMQLYRKLTALTGKPANEFIRFIRLQRAAQLLRDSHLTVSEVTYEVGFSDLKYFRKRFKDQYGLNPSDYVALHRGGQHEH